MGKQRTKKVWVALSWVECSEHREPLHLPRRGHCSKVQRRELSREARASSSIPFWRPRTSTGASFPVPWRAPWRMSTAYTRLATALWSPARVCLWNSPGTAEASSLLQPDANISKLKKSSSLVFDKIKLCPQFHWQFELWSIVYLVKQNYKSNFLILAEANGHYLPVALEGKF